MGYKYGFGSACCDCCDWFDTFDEDSSSNYTSNAETGSVTWNYDTDNSIIQQTNSGEGTYYRIGGVDLNSPNASIRLSARIREGTANSKVGIFIGQWVRFYAQFDLNDFEADEVTNVGEEDSNQPNLTGTPTPADGDVVAIEIFYQDWDDDGNDELGFQLVVNSQVVYEGDGSFSPGAGGYSDLNMGLYSDGGGEWEWVKLECNAIPTQPVAPSTPCLDNLATAIGRTEPWPSVIYVEDDYGHVHELVWDQEIGFWNYADGEVWTMQGDEATCSEVLIHRPTGFGNISATVSCYSIPAFGEIGLQFGAYTYLIEGNEDPMWKWNGVRFKSSTYDLTAIDYNFPFNGVVYLYGTSGPLGEPTTCFCYPAVGCDGEVTPPNGYISPTPINARIYE